MFIELSVNLYKIGYQKLTHYDSLSIDVSGRFFLYAAYVLNNNYLPLF